MFITAQSIISVKIRTIISKSDKIKKKIYDYYHYDNMALI